MLKEKFPGVYEFGGSILTRNLAPGKKVYGEEFKTIDGKEYRVWNPYRSKLGAAIKNGLKEFPIKPGICCEKKFKLNSVFKKKQTSFKSKYDFYTAVSYLNYKKQVR